MSLLDHPLIAQRYFYPRRAPLADATFVDVDGARLACWRHAPHPDGGTVVYFHGNGEVVADYVDGFGDVFAAMGWNLFMAEYRGYGGSTGAPALASMLGDVGPILDAVGAPRSRVVAFGRSIGSIYAIHAASIAPDLGGLILESGVADVLERIAIRVTPRELGVTSSALCAAVDEELGHSRKLGAWRGPTLVMHARHDDLVDVSHGERLAAWAAGPTTLEIFPRGDHNSILHANAPAYWAAVRRLLAGLPGP